MTETSFQGVAPMDDIKADVKDDATLAAAVRQAVNALNDMLVQAERAGLDVEITYKESDTRRPGRRALRIYTAAVTRVTSL